VAAVRLTIVANDIEAETLCGLLRANGIPCAHRSTDLAAGATYGGASLTRVGPTEVLVDESDLAAARYVLTDTDPDE
jgi:hypothetical protein